MLENEVTLEDESDEIAQIFNDVEIRGDAFSMDEYEKVKSTLVSGKASGEDGIPKSEDLRSASSYRGTSLSLAVAKAHDKLILNRIKSGIDHKLRINQNEARNNRTTTDHILAIELLLEGAKKKNLPALFTFIDFKKAFDTVHRGKMFKILQAYGILDILVTAIKNMYINTQAKVLSPDGETRSFGIQVVL